MTAENTRKSSTSLARGGRAVRPSEPAAACPCATTTDTVSFGDCKLRLDADTILSLLCLLDGLLGETLSGDRLALAMYGAKARAERLGLSEERFAEVANAVFAANEPRRKGHPFVKGGFM